MASVRRVAPILLLAVTVAAWADDPQPKKKPASTSTTTTTSATATTTTVTATAAVTTAAPAATTTSVTTSTTTSKPAAKAATETAKPAKRAKAKAAKAAKRETASRPPRELHLLGNHWTPYNPPDPATYPPNARTHEIKQGETLSGIARQEYGNSDLWPQLWETNTWITDAHWIYPGDVLLVQGEAAAAATTTPATETTTTTTTTTPAQGATAQQQPSTGPVTITAAEVHREAPPIALGAEADVYCYGYIGDPNLSMPNTVESFEDVEVMSPPGPVDQGSPGSNGDLLFVHGGTSTGLVAGETYMVIELGDLVVHPKSGEVIGRQYNYQGQIRILCADETRSRAMIVQNCREIHVGAHLVPMPQIPIPIARVPELPAFCDAPTNRSTGYIIDSQSWYEALGEGNLVEVNLGHDDQIQPGDFLTVYRDVPGQARQVLGEIGILTTQPHTSTGRIVSMRRMMLIGDSVEAR